MVADRSGLSGRVDAVDASTRQRSGGGASAASRLVGLAVEPPSGNTGVDFTKGVRPRPAGGVGVSLGWLSCTWVGHFASLVDFLNWSEAFVGELLPAVRRWRGYEIVYAGAHGVLLGVRERDGGVLELHLDAPAAVLEGMDLEALQAFLECVALHAQNVTRCDLTLDDWCKVITPIGLDVLTSGGADAYALNKDQCVTRAQQSTFMRSKGPKGGDTWYLGGSKGDARLRVYDKARESEGMVDAIRWELQLRGDRAKDAVVMLACEAKTRGLDLAEVMGPVVQQQLVRFVDFRQRGQDSNISRCDRLLWFCALVEGAEKARPVVVPPPLTVERMHDHAAVSLPSWLATLADSAPVVVGASPELWILSMLDEGRRKRSARHSLALRSAGVRA